MKSQKKLDAMLEKAVRSGVGAKGAAALTKFNNAQVENGLTKIRHND